MHNLILLMLAPLALANDLSKRSLLLPRQGGDAFIPDTTITFECQYPCGEEDCLRPSRGDTCCAEGYGCPGGSFCLTKGYCCPDGDDPATCASQNGVTLPAGFKPGQTVPVALSTSPSTSTSSSSTSSSSTSPSSTTSSSTVKSLITPSSSPTPSPPLSTSSLTAPFPTPTPTTTTLLPPSTATGSTAPGKTTVVPFTGGGAIVRFALDGAAVVAVVVGAVGLVLG